MRADRLVAALLVMQGRSQITAAQLAEQLEVSVATARRDLEALGAAGLPVYPQPGRGGGWSLLGGARTDLSGLTSAEAQALFLAIGPVASAIPEVRSGLRKLTRALPGTFRAGAQAAASAVVIDPAPWGERGAPPSELTGILQQAVVERRQVRLTYQGRSRERTQRLVDAWGLAAKNEIWYLIAGTDRGQRTFRVDRITEAELTDQESQRPADFDLTRAWGEVVDQMEARRSLLTATVLIAPALLPVLRDRFGRQFAELPGEGQETDGGRARVQVSAPTARDVARHLAGWGGLIEVVEPAAVQSELARIGAELTARYGGQPPERAG